MNLMLPGNPRYQPKELIPFFGYDNNFRFVADVEIATLEALAEIGVIPKEDIDTFTAEDRQALRSITTSEVDERERKVTKHDVRAWIQLAKERLNPKIAKWIHVPLTSYDALDTARTLQFVQCYKQETLPRLVEVVETMAELVENFSDTLQIGRTHGQHALPITVGFWLATILNRIVYSVGQIHEASTGLVGKISGAVGAYNAQVGMGITEQQSFEHLVLGKLRLQPGPISNQIVQPEPLAYFLHGHVVLSAAFGQFGRDCRQLMRSEIGEIQEEFGEGQVGSSTMAHKRNPISFENLEGTWLKNKSEYYKVLETLISEHQRDLVASSLYRDFPIMVSNVHWQLRTLLAKDKNHRSFLSRISVNKSRCHANFEASKHLVLAEPLYIVLQMAGYEGDAHDLVNHSLVNVATISNKSLIVELECLCEQDHELRAVVERIPLKIRQLFYTPENYVGLASERSLEIATQAKSFVARLKEE